MIYILKHKKYGTFYCLESSTIQVEKAFRFKSRKQAEKARNKMNNPDRWEILEVKK